jgi:hypothetical protein
MRASCYGPDHLLSPLWHQCCRSSARAVQHRSAVLLRAARERVVAALDGRTEAVDLAWSSYCAKAWRGTSQRTLAPALQRHHRLDQCVKQCAERWAGGGVVTPFVYVPSAPSYTYGTRGSTTTSHTGRGRATKLVIENEGPQKSKGVQSYKGPLEGKPRACPYDRRQDMPPCSRQGPSTQIDSLPPNGAMS